jgi:hypothetical protein
MMQPLFDSWPLLAFSQTPALPSLTAIRLDQCLGWGLVLAWCGCMGLDFSLRRLHIAQRKVRCWQACCVLVLMLWCWLPGPLSPRHWLALAFQTPSLVSQILCLQLLWRLFQRPFTHHSHHLGKAPAYASGWVFAAVLLGWVLLADTFAFWPITLYNLGFGPWALLLLLLALAYALKPGVQKPAQTRPMGWVLGMTALVFVSLRLPTGNLWDALLDPWLWLLLHAILLRRILSKRRWPVLG